MAKTPPTEETLLRKQWRFYIGLLTLFTILLASGLSLLIIQPDFSFVDSGKKIDSSRRTSMSIVASLPEDNRVVNGIHLATGMPYDERFPIVKATCTACHSSKLVTQNRATREGWKQMIEWMQKTQNLWDLGNNEDIILDYLAEYYAPKKVGRRSNLQEVEYYLLNLE